MAIPRNQGLDALSQRDYEKPYDLLRRDDGSYPMERTIYRDALTGAQVWKMTHDPAMSRHIYYDIPAWNADGSLLFFISFRPGEGDRNWLMGADGGNLRELLIEGDEGHVQRPLWSQLDPEIMFYPSHHPDRTTFCSYNVRTGERRETHDGLVGQPEDVLARRDDHTRRGRLGHRLGERSNDGHAPVAPVEHQHRPVFAEPCHE